ncbi:uncharacterized protein LOC135805148 [Sycon ciliatum]|uniref:uncharacterized protein LOC135805148 n=1 Tax=Sycon ciliatum TaxID=27933 RepID=UPI0020ADEB1C|eukprot:scpid69212/ scgid0426/ 
MESVQPMPAADQNGSRTLIEEITQTPFVKHADGNVLVCVNEDYGSTGGQQISFLGTPDKQRREAHALFDRKAAMADEIDLCKGDYLVITDIHEDGWARGKNFRTKKYGLLPINHVRILPKQPQEEQHVQQRQSSQSSQ